MNTDDTTTSGNMTQLAAAIGHSRRIEADDVLDIAKVSDAEVDQILRMAGGDPDAIGKRGLNEVLAELRSALRAGR